MFMVDMFIAPSKNYQNNIGEHAHKPYVTYTNLGSVPEQDSLGPPLSKVYV